MKREMLRDASRAALGARLRSAVLAPPLPGLHSRCSLLLLQLRQLVGVADGDARETAQLVLAEGEDAIEAPDEYDYFAWTGLDPGRDAEVADPLAYGLGESLEEDVAAGVRDRSIAAASEQASQSQS